MGRAGRAVKQAAHCRARLGVRWAASATHLGEEVVECAVRTPKLRRRQPVPSCEQVGLRSAQCFPLVVEKLQRKAGIELGIVDPTALEPAVLIVLDEVMIWIPRECEGAQTQRVYGGQGQQSQVGLRRLEVGQVEGDQVVTENERRAVGKFVELCERRGRSAAGMPLTSVPTHSAEGANAAVLLAYLEVDGETAGPEGLILR